MEKPLLLGTTCFVVHLRGFLFVVVFFSLKVMSYNAEMILLALLAPAQYFCHGGQKKRIK